MSKSEADLTALIDDISEREAKDRRVLSHLLDKYAKQKGKFFAIRSEMGYALEETGSRVRIPSFTIVQSLDWIGKEIKMGSEMPFMRNNLVDGKLVVDESIAESVKQRAPDYRRQKAIAAYLAHDKRRKFGTIVAVINPQWSDDPSHENWGPDGRAIRSGYKFEPLDSSGAIGLLEIEQENLYALDGQHRVMGIRGIQEVQEKGFLQIKTKDGAGVKGKVIAREDFMEMFRLDTAELQGLLNESISLELIPAVVSGETHAEASRRVRSVFITINAYAQKTGKSETTLLDESDGFAIVARKAGTLHPLFMGGVRVNWKTATIPKARSKWYTTLETVKEMAKAYLTRVAPRLTDGWEALFDKQVPIRPSESDIETAREEFFELLTRLHELPVFAGLESGDEIDDIRSFPGYNAENPDEGDGHLLTRPVGQVIVGMAVGQLIEKGEDLDSIFAKLAVWDDEGGFSQHLPSSVWFGVTYDFHREKMNTRTNYKLASDLLAYMVRGGSQEERRRLLVELIANRGTGKPGESSWINFQGEEEKYDPENSAKNSRLPVPIGG